MLWTFKQHLGSCLKLQKPHCKKFWWTYNKNESCRSYLGNKKQKLMFTVVSRSDGHFGFECPSFVCPIVRASKTAFPKNWTWWIQFVQACVTSRFAIYVQIFLTVLHCLLYYCILLLCKGRSYLIFLHKVSAIMQ